MREHPSRRPRPAVERTAFDVLGETGAAAGVFAGIVLLVGIWGALPESVPRHFGIDGEPTAWSGRWSAVVPIVIATLIYLVLTLLGRVPHVFNYPWPINESNAGIQYRLSRSMLTWLTAFLVWMFVFVVWSQWRVATGASEGLSPFLVIGFLVAITLILAAFVYRGYRHRDGALPSRSSASRSEAE